MTEPQPKPLGDLLKDILRKARPSQRALRGQRLAQKVFSESFKEFAAHASVVSVRVGVVTIEVESSAAFQELEGFQRQKLLDAFRSAGLQVSEVRVRLAT
ncbi:MAG: DciA family protein [Planctomycetota bacterium]